MKFRYGAMLCFTLFGCFVGVQAADQSPWSPLADRTISPQQRQREVEKRRIEWPSPVRLSKVEQAQHEVAGDFDVAGRSDLSMTTSDEGYSAETNPVEPASRLIYAHEFIPEDLPPSHAVIRSPQLRKTPSPRPDYHRLGYQNSNEVNVNSVSGNFGARQSANHRSLHGQNARHRSPFHGDTSQQTLPAPPIHGKHSKFGKNGLIVKQFRPIEPKPAMIANAREKEVWKQPYSYGHFGASGSRHWNKHHGYRDRYTEWRYK